MAEVPLAEDKLEKIVYDVAKDLLEEWAINDRFEEDQIEQATKNAVDDVVLVINSYMERFNALMDEMNLNQASKLHISN